MKPYGLLDWQRQAILDAYLGGEKVEAIAAEFGVKHNYPVMLAARRRATTRLVGRPTVEFIESWRNPKMSQVVSTVVVSQATCSL